METGGGLLAGTAGSCSAVVRHWPGPALVLAGARRAVGGVWNILMHTLQACACTGH